MARKVKIKSLPKAQTGLSTGSGLSSNFKQMPWQGSPLHSGEQEIKTRNKLEGVPRDMANLEAEKGEIVVVPGEGNIPNVFEVGGQRHTKGGTPLRLPEHSFVYSDTKSMIIKDPAILAQFGMPPRKKGYTPAEIAGKYKTNKFFELLKSPNSTDEQRKTAEMMITNYNLKLSKLALIQESMKGFPDEIPYMAMPYMEHMQIAPEMLFGTGEEGFPDQMPMAQVGGSLPKAQTGQSFSRDQYLQSIAHIKLSDPATYQRMVEEYDRQNSMGAIGAGAGNTAGNAIGNIGSQALGSAGQDFDGTYDWDYTGKKKNNFSGEAKAETYLSAMNLFTNIFNQDERAALEEWKKNHQDPTNLFATVSGNRGIWDQFGGFNPYLTGEGSTSQFSGINQIPRAKTGGSMKKKVRIKALPNTLPKAQTGATVTNQPKPDYDFYMGQVEKLLADEDFVNAMYEEYIAEIKNAKNVDKALLKVPKEEAVRRLLQLQRNNFKMREAGLDLSKSSKEAWDYTDKGKNSKYRETAIAAGVIPEDIFKDDIDITIAQAAFNAAAKVAAKVPEFEKKYGPIYTLTGKGDEKYDPKNPSLSAPDTFYGNDTSGYLLFSDAKPKYAKAVRPPQEKREQAPEETYIPPMDWGQPQQQAAPMWLQDKIGILGNAADLWRIKKHQPWQQIPNFHLPETAYYSPERELAANAEMVNQTIQGLSSFADPQSYMANATQVMGQGMKNAADITSKYNNLNVGQYDRHQNIITDILNRAEQASAAGHTQLYDKYTILEQQFQNAKNQARQNLRNSIIQGVTNRANAQALNTIYENYQIDPSTGGMVYMPSGRPMTPSYTDPDKKLKYVQQLYQDNPWLKDSPEALKYILAEQDNTTPPGMTQEQQAFLQGRYPGALGYGYTG